MGNKNCVGRSTAEMVQIIEDWASGKESRSGYCARRGLSLDVFNDWIRRIGQKTGDFGFQEVKEPESAVYESCVPLLYPDGRVLEFVGEGSMDHLRAVLSW